LHHENNWGGGGWKNVISIRKQGRSALFNKKAGERTSLSKKTGGKRTF